MASSMRLAILLSLTGLALSASLDADLCEKGEAFWCQSIAAAEFCSAVDHCSETIWRNQKLEKDESTTCLFCEAVVSDALEMSTGKSQDEVIAFLNSASDLLPDTDIATQIKKTLERKSIPKILKSEITPQMVCSLLKLCKGLQVEDDLHKPEFSLVETPEPTACQDCKDFFSTLRKFITNQTSLLLKDILLDKVCSRATIYKPQCTDFASNLLPQTIKLLASFMDEGRICRGIRMCQKSKIEDGVTPFNEDFPSVDWKEVVSLFQAEQQQTKQTDELRQPSTCTDCSDFFTSLKGLLNDQTSPLIRDVLVDKVCPRLGKGLQTWCDGVARNWLPGAIRLALDFFLDPKQVCQSMKLCQKSQSEVPLNSIVWTKLIFQNETSMLLSPKSCSDCNKFFTSVRDLLKGGASDFLTDVLVEQICPLTGSFRKQCEDLANMYLKVVIGFIATTLDPDKVCKSIGMCKKYENEIESDLFLIDLSSIDWETLFENQGDSKCEACKTGVQFVQNFFKSEAVKSSITLVIEKLVCVRLGPLRIPCEKMVGSELRTLLDLAARLLDPAKVCRTFRLCKNSDVIVVDEKERSFPVLDDSEKPGVVDCALCAKFIVTISKAIEVNKTKEDILEGMHVLCSNLQSGNEVIACNAFVDDFGWLAIDLYIRWKYQPNVVCRKLGFCNDFKFDLLDAEAVKGSYPCVICRSAVQYVEAFVDQTDTVAMIQGQLKTLCHSLSPTLERDVCIPFVDKYIPPLIHELSVSLPPKFFCTKIRICTDSAED